MIISSATPQDLVEWFHSRQEKQRLLCVLLAPSKADQKKIIDLVDDVYATDAVLGDEVAFLLLHPGADTTLGLDKGYGEFATLRGTVFSGSKSKSGLAYALRDAEIFRDMSDEGEPYRRDIAEKSSRAMGLFVPAFMKLFSVNPGELPALCIVIKGMNDSVVLPLGTSWTVESLLEVLTKIRAIADRLPNFREEYQSLADAVPMKLHTVADAAREISAKTAKITEILEQILRRYPASELDRALLSEFVAGDFRGEAHLQAAFSNLSFKSNDRFLKDGQVIKVLGFARRLDTLRADLNDDIAGRKYVLTISDRVQQLDERRSQIFEAIQALGPARYTITSQNASAALVKVSGFLDGLKTVGEVGAKLASCLDWVRKATGLTN